MSILPYYNGWVLVDNNGERGTNNYYAKYPYRSTYLKKHAFYVYYCGHPKCLRRIYKTWSYCPYCGQQIEWEKDDDRKKV